MEDWRLEHLRQGGCTEYSRGQSGTVGLLALFRKFPTYPCQTTKMHPKGDHNDSCSDP